MSDAFSFSEAEKRFELPSGSVERKAKTKYPGERFQVAEAWFVLLEGEKVRPSTKTLKLLAGGNTPGTEGSDKAQEVQMLTRVALHDLGSKFRILVSDSGIYTPLEVPEPGVVRTISRDSLLLTLLQNYGAELLPSKIKNELLPLFISKLAQDALRPESIRQLRFASDHAPDYAWARVPFDPDHNAKCPVDFDSIMRRTGDGRQSGELFFGSLLDYKSTRAQYLHLSGQGNDGKSTLTAMIAAVFKGSTVTFKARDFDDKHSSEKLEGARILMFHDEEDGRFMSNGDLKALTGDDVITINPKHHSRRTILLNLKVIISSNTRPEIRGTKADMRRIVPVYLESYGGKDAPQDPSFVARIMEARYQAMQYCYAQWMRYVEAGGVTIPLSKTATEDIENYAVAADANEAFNKWFVKDSKGEVPMSVVASLLKNEPPYIAKQLRASIRANPEFKLIRPNSDEAGTRPRVYQGFKAREISTK